MAARTSSTRRHAPDPLVEACLRSLRALGPTVEVSFSGRDDAGDRIDGELHVRSSRTRPKGERFFVQATRTHLSYALVAGIIAHTRGSHENSVLFAPYVPGPIGQHLAEHHLSYVDVVGNCHLVVGRELLFHVEGKKQPRDSKTRGGGRVPSYQLMFAILARPALLDEPVRRIAEAAGIGKTAAADQLARLQEQALLVNTRAGLQIVRYGELLDRWLSAYAELVRPRWLVGRYRTQTNDPEALEAKLAELNADTTWALGGGAAAWRMTHFYRGPETVVHVLQPPSDLPRHLRAIPAQDGPLTILHTPGVVAYQGAEPNLAHPLLVYTEMLASGDPRMREAAQELLKRFLPEAR